MKREIRIALAGDVGSVPATLLGSISSQDVRFEAICDSSGERSEKAARTYGVRWPFDDLDKMLVEAEPDAVIIAAPNDIRTEWIKQCLSRKAAVLVLGAPAVKQSQCATLGRLARRANRQVMIGLAQRFNPAGVRARRLLESSKLGPIASIDLTVTWARTPDRFDSPDFPIPFDLAFEAADRLRSFNIVPRQVWAVRREQGHLAAMVLGQDNEVISLGLHHTGTPQSAGSRLELRSDDGGVLVLTDEVNLTCTVGSRLVAMHQPRLGIGDDPRIESGHAAVISAFVTAVRDQQGVPYGLPSATEAVVLAEAIFRAAKSGRTVKTGHRG